ncbi:MAG: carbon-nitrogen hydrolase family protein, partial [Planctomycetota bacterium]
MSRTGRAITVSAGQLTARLMSEAAATLGSIDALIAGAAAAAVDLLVLPECAYPAYLLGSVDSYGEGDHLSGEEYVSWLCGRASRHGLHIVSGFVDDACERLYNAAVFIDGSGVELGRSRKRFLWHAEHNWFSPGDELCCFDSDIGRLGMIICAETRAPELVAGLVADGAELLAMPTCWVNVSSEPGEFRNPQIDFLVSARAREFGVPFVCADKWGIEYGAIGYVGQSRIVGADGELLVAAAAEGSGIITAQLTLGAPPAVLVSDAHRRRLLADVAPVRPPA